MRSSDYPKPEANLSENGDLCHRDEITQIFEEFRPAGQDVWGLTLDALPKEEPVNVDPDVIETDIELDPAIEKLFPIEFWIDPKAWIEAQPTLSRQEAMQWGVTSDQYDFSRVKLITLDDSDGRDVKVVSKRLKGNAAEEIARAKEAYSADIPTPKVLGQMALSDGTIYMLTEYVPAIDLNEIFERKGGRLNLILVVPPPEFELTEIKFQQNMRHCFPDHAHDTRFIDLWQKYLPAIAASEFHYIQRTILLGFNSIQKATEWLYEKCIFDYHTTIVQKSGYKDIDGFMHKFTLHPIFSIAYPKESRFALPKSPENEKIISEFLASLKLKFEETLAKFKKEWMALLIQTELGFDLIAEIESLRRMCAKKGIEHKDFNYRNLLLEWDFENDRPLIADGKAPRLWLIDWEVPEEARPTGEGKSAEADGEA
jgi:hypothetical protein